jgi:hypothetical protein
MTGLLNRWEARRPVPPRSAASVPGASVVGGKAESKKIPSRIPLLNLPASAVVE